MSEDRLSQTQLAEATEVSQGAVSGWLNGAIPHRKKLNAIAAFLHVNPEWLLTGQGEKTLVPLQVKLGHSLLPIADSGPMPQLETLAERVAFLRKREKITFQKFGELCGVHKSYILRLEKGERINPTDYFLDRCAMAFGVSLQWLKTGVATPPYADPPYKSTDEIQPGAMPSLLPGELPAIGGFDPAWFPGYLASTMNMPVSLDELKTLRRSFQEDHSRETSAELLAWGRKYLCAEGPSYRTRVIVAVLLIEEIQRRLVPEPIPKRRSKRKSSSSPEPEPENASPAKPAPLPPPR